MRSESRPVTGRLNDQYHWLVRAPIQLDLEEGRVAAFTNREALLSRRVSLFGVSWF